MRLRFIVLGRPDQLRGTGDHTIQPADKQRPLRHQHDASPVGLQRLPRRHVNPAEATAFGDRTFRCIAKIVDIARCDIVQDFYRFVSHRLRPPIQKVFNHPEARRLAFFRVELRADHIIATHDRGLIAPIIDTRQQSCALR